MKDKKKQKDSICPCCCKKSHNKWVLNENFWMCVYCGNIWEEKKCLKQNNAFHSTDCH